MRARRLTTILPAMTLDEAIEIMRINHVAGLIGAATTVVTTWTFRAPHHTISDVGLIGGYLVKNVSRLSSQQACAPVPVHGQADVIFTNRGVGRHGCRARCRGRTMVCSCCRHSRSVGVTSLGWSIDRDETRLDVRSAGQERRRMRSTEGGAHQRLSRRPR
jgi:Magnesium chelatase, subunit ChlI